MATVKQTSAFILSHPYFRFALQKMEKGDSSAFERLLLEYGLHIWERCALDASRIYGQYHRLNHCDIKKEIRNMAPPGGLDLRLPAVEVQKKEAIIKPIKKKKPLITTQLSIQFPEALIRQLKIA